MMGENSNSKARLLTVIIATLTIAESLFLPAIAAVRVTVSVNDADGRPIARAKVDVDDPAHSSAITDSKGHATIALTAVGSYRYHVAASGFRAQSGTLNANDAPVVLRIFLETSAGALHVIGSVTGHARAPFNATPVSQKIYPREAYRDQGQPSVSSVMNQTPGLSALMPIGSNTGTPLATAFASVRNALPFETPVSIDGEPVSLPSSGAFNLSLMPTFALQEVEAVKGPGDIAGDGGGTGGALNFRTAEPTLVRRGTFEIEGDSRGGSFADFAYDGTEPGGKLAFATMLSDDGSPCCQPFPADLSRNLTLLKLRDMPSQNITLTGTVMNVNEQRDAASLYPLGFYGTLSQHLGFADIAASVDRGADAYALHLYTSEITADISGQTSDTTSGASLEWQHASGKLTYALTGRVSRGDASGQGAYTQPLLPGTGETTTLLRASGTYRPAASDEIDAALESAHVAADVAPSGAQFVSRTFDAPQGRVAWAHILEPGLSVRAAYGSSAVLPPLDALSGSTSYTTNVQYLERAVGTDVGLEWRLHGNTTTLSADLYRTSTTGVYMLEPQPILPSIWANGPPMVESGAELSLQQFKPVGFGYIATLSLPRTYVWGNLPNGFYQTGNFAVVPGQNLNGGLPIIRTMNDVAPYRIPYAQGYGEISYKWPRGSRLSLGALYVGSNNVYGAPAFVTLNSNLELSLGAKSKLQLSAENLTNQLGNRFPVFGLGVSGFSAFGQAFPSYASGLQPLTLRFMFRQSFGEGQIYEH